MRFLCFVGDAFIVEVDDVEFEMVTGLKDVYHSHASQTTARLSQMAACLAR